jgi:hypothetical protein
MLIEVIRLKLARPLKARFDRDFKSFLAETPTASAAAAVVRTAAIHRLANVKYHGQKTHEKQVLAYLEKALTAEFSEQQLVDICASLPALGSRKLADRYFHLGQKKYPSNPDFYLLEAETNLERGPYRGPTGETQELLKKALEKAQALPHDQRREAILQKIKKHQEMIAALNPFSRLLGSSPFGGPFGGPPDDLFDWDDVVDAMDDDEATW